MRYKDLWFAEYERKLNELEDAGVPPKHADRLAAEHAESAAPERLADMADRMRKRERGE